MRPSNRRREIVRLLADGKRRGLNYAEIAKLAGIARSTLAVWAWRLRREARGCKSVPECPRFVELVAKRGPEVAPVEIALASGRRITVASNIDRHQLVELVTTLESC